MTLARVLPWPPSANRYWRRAGRHIHLSEAGREYRARVASMVPQRVFGAQRVAVTIVAHPPDRRRRDIDNLCKATLDALQFARVFDDDSQVDALCVVRGVVGAVLAWVVHGSDSVERRAAVEVACPEQCLPVYDDGRFTCEARGP